MEIIMQCFQSESLKSIYNPATHQAELRQHVAKVLKIKEIFTNTIPREGIHLSLSTCLGVILTRYLHMKAIKLKKRKLRYTPITTIVLITKSNSQCCASYKSVQDSSSCQHCKAILVVGFSSVAMFDRQMSVCFPWFYWDDVLVQLVGFENILELTKNFNHELNTDCLTFTYHIFFSVKELFW